MTLATAGDDTDEFNAAMAANHPLNGRADQNATGAKPSGTPRLLKLLTLAECASARPRGYIVKGLIAPGDFAVMFGPPGAGKSVVAPFIAHAVAAGCSVFARRVKRGPVLYVAAEDGTGMKLRAAALLRAYGDAPGFVIAPDPINLQGDGIADPPDLAAIILAADRVGAVLIVLDTLAAAFPGLDENDGRDMGRAVRLLREMRTEKRAVLAIHHGAKSGGTTPRGHGVLDGAADVTLRIEVPEDRAAPRVVKLGKNRNGTTLADFAFTIRAETMGEDTDGDPITAPLAVEAEDQGAHARKNSRPLTETQRGWLRDLTDMLAGPDAVRIAPIDGMAKQLTLTREKVRSGLRVRGRFEAEPHAPLTPKDRRAFADTLNALRDKGKIGMTDELLWLT